MGLPAYPSNTESINCWGFCPCLIIWIKRRGSTLYIFHFLLKNLILLSIWAVQLALLAIPELASLSIEPPPNRTHLL
jgi:hypothetical protein